MPSLPCCGRSSSSPSGGDGDDDPSGVEKREEWTSRAAFYFAAVGSAVGFGNVWRFPSLVYEYGGGAFFIPYAMALFFVGLPILVLEVALGQYYQTGDVGAFGSIHARLRGVGMSSVACGYMLVTYYSMLLAWVINAFVRSFDADSIWSKGEVTGKEAKDYFFNTIIGMSTLGSDLRPTRIVPENVGYSFLTWFLIYLCTAFGLKWTGYITYFTMGFPVVLLFVFLGRAVTLEGAQDGIYEYIGYANWEILTEQPRVWATAVSQIFFSLGVTFGIMTAYGSHCKKGEPAFMNSCVVAISNSMFSFISGFAVYATLGYSALKENATDLTKIEYKGFGLVFGTWPVALGTLPGGEHWIRLLFVMLFLLGIDSAFSFVEGLLTVLQDTVLFRDGRRWLLCAVLTGVAFLLSLMYATDAGLLFLDAIDYYINFVMLLVGGFECFAAGWVYGIEGQIEVLGTGPVMTYMATTFGSVILACIVWFSVPDGGTAVWAGFVALVLSYLAGTALVLVMLGKRKALSPDLTWPGMLNTLLMQNVLDLKAELSKNCGWLPTAWAFLIKHFIPPLILILFALDADTTNANGKKKFGDYEGYPVAPYQVLGILIVVFTAFLFLTGALLPKMYSGMQRPPKAEEATFKGGDGEVAHPEEAAEEPAKDEEDAGGTAVAVAEPAGEEAEAAAEDAA